MRSPEPKSAALKSAEPKSVAPKSAEPSLIQNTRTVHSIKQMPTRVQRYGPGACVKTWRDATSGHCIMETDCPDSEDLTVYEFGLLCEGHGGHRQARGSRRWPWACAGPCPCSCCSPSCRPH